MLFAALKRAPRIVSPERWIEFRDVSGAIVCSRDLGKESFSTTTEKDVQILDNVAYRMVLAVFPAALADLKKICEGDEQKYQEAFPISVSFFEKRGKGLGRGQSSQVRVSSISYSGIILSPAEFKFKGATSGIFTALLVQISEKFNPEGANSFSFAFKFDNRFFVVELRVASETNEHSDEKLFLTCDMYPFPKIELSSNKPDEPKMHAFSTLIEATLGVSKSSDEARVEMLLSKYAMSGSEGEKCVRLGRQQTSQTLLRLVCESCRFCSLIQLPRPKKCSECSVCGNYVRKGD